MVNNVRIVLGMAVVATCLTGCQTPRSKDLPSGAAAYASFPPPNEVAPRDYMIGPFDVLNITVFKEPDLTFKELPVDASGNMLFPLIGSVHAGGKSATDLSREIAARLNERFLNNAQVSVVVASSVSQHVTVEGSVLEPGVYDIGGSTTLLEAVARAKSPTRTAKLDQVAVFRFVNGKRTGAIFNLDAIRNGYASDPALQGGDIVVVGFSALKGGFRDILNAAPFLGLFRAF